MKKRKNNKEKIEWTLESARQDYNKDKDDKRIKKRTCKNCGFGYGCSEGVYCKVMEVNIVAFHGFSAHLCKYFKNRYEVNNDEEK